MKLDLKTRWTGKHVTLVVARKMQTRLMMVCLVLQMIVITIGCKSHPPGGTVIEPPPVGAVIDQINQTQEENAEYAKLIIYCHEFEINLQEELTPPNPDIKKVSGFEYKPSARVRGYRLTPDGQDHVRQIAEFVKEFPFDLRPPVVVERSRTSKHWDTEHQYPVHFNDDLDDLRRRMVVETLAALGVDNADGLVVVAPAYPTGQNALEAAAAYSNAIGTTGATNSLFGR